MPRQRTDLGILLEGVAHLDSAHLLHKQLLEWASYFLGHDEAFCGNATLTGVHQAPLGADRGGHFQIRILEHEIGIAATELEHCLLQHLASLAGDRTTGGCAAPPPDNAGLKGLAARRGPAEA